MIPWIVAWRVRVVVSMPQSKESRRCGLHATIEGITRRLFSVEAHGSANPSADISRARALEKGVRCVRPSLTLVTAVPVAASFRAPVAAVASTRYVPLCAALRPVPSPRVASSVALVRRASPLSVLVGGQ